MRFPPLTPVVRLILMTSLLAFVVQLVLEVWLGIPYSRYVAIQSGIHYSIVWKVFTYPLAQLAPTVGPFLMNGLFAWLILSPFELAYGRKALYRVLWLSLLGGAIPAVAAGLVFPGGLAGLGPLILGPLSAEAWMIHLRRGKANVFGAFEIDGKGLLFIALGLSMLSFLASRDVVSLFADLGAIGAGILFTKMHSKPKKVSKVGSKSHLRIVKTDEKREPPEWLN